MKGITITKDNFPMIIGRLQKFFQHEEFLTWWCRSGGMKKRLSHRIDTTKTYYEVETAVSNEDFIITLPENWPVYEEGYNTSFYHISVSDVIWFLGSRIVCRKRTDFFKDTPYLYFCLQILKE